MKEIILATSNAHKVREIKEILGAKFTHIYTLADKGIDVEVEETGSTFMENAIIKARAIAEIANMPALADDSGLCVDALNGEPGVYSARYSGARCDSKANNELLLSRLSDVQERDRSAWFKCAVALVCPDGDIVTAEGAAEGIITRSYCGRGGFGYDPIFYSLDLDKTFAEASEEEKNAVSHRGRALAALVDKL